MKLYIPENGDEIRLLADWTFDLYNEDRNSSLMEKIGDTRKVTWGGGNYGTIPCTIPAGAVLKIDRVYIRKGNKEYSSITFLWKGEALPSRMETYLNGETYKVPRIPIRFWAKLSDVNNIEFEKA
jgi:hypothetical protein